jgi:methylmalonyl-CoA/ethylmalonyl-CoA epimerase
MTDHPMSVRTHPLLTEIDHVGIAVRDLDSAISYYRDTFGATVTHREVIDLDGVEEALISVADSYIQLLSPTRPDSPVARFLERRGEGLHHVGYRVDDCATAIESVRNGGGTLIDESPRPGSRGTTVAFVHPKGAFGTLIELVQEP